MVKQIYGCLFDWNFFYLVASKLVQDAVVHFELKLADFSGLQLIEFKRRLQILGSDYGITQQPSKGESYE